jgi:predicted nucleic acid-binding protein
MALPIVVPDASVILKWVLPAADEADLEPALAFRDAIAAGDVHAVVPTLWVYEVGNTLARRYPERAGRTLDALLRFDLVNAPRSPRWLRHVLALTERYGVTFYDAAYHAHALARRGVFVTADERYLERAGAAGGLARLSEWAPRAT